MRILTDRAIPGLERRLRRCDPVRVAHHPGTPLERQPPAAINLAYRGAVVALDVADLLPTLIGDHSHHRCAWVEGEGNGHDMGGTVAAQGGERAEMPVGQETDVGVGEIAWCARHGPRGYRLMAGGPDRDEVEAWYRYFQERFCAFLAEVDPRTELHRDVWQRPGGGGGDTRILIGPIIEKAAVNLSAVWGDTPSSLRARVDADSFFATGVSIIVHPKNPFAPTFHANVRYFEAGPGGWFGGGTDLTPWYLNESDAEHFHRTIRDVCGRHPIADYGAWKQACDEYFFLPHRGEARGIGGIFFDHLDREPSDVWAFQRDLADALEPAYRPILERRISTEYGPDQERWHHHRRGRYVEFNLAWDRGTRFGLETGGRADSILASLPPYVRWEPLAEPPAGSPEAELLALLRGRARDWT